MNSLRLLRIFACATPLVIACGSGPDEDPLVDCTGVEPVALAVGQHLILDASGQGCVVVPEAGPAGGEHLYVALSGEGRVEPEGVTAPYELRGSPAGAAVAARGVRAAHGRGGPAMQFHDRLRRLEGDLAAEAAPGALSREAPAGAAVPPVVGAQRTFKVCASTTCTGFVDVTATARVVAQRVGIYLDDEAPDGGYTDFDLQTVGRLFDDHLYPIDTTAFGRESDIDGNGVVIVLLTQRINQLSACNTTGSLILGYFFGLDLLPDRANSNGGEIFYGLVPDPTSTVCTVTRSEALGLLPPVFAHEFQHMISYNQRVLVRSSSSTEATWLNEGLSHFAEELAGRQVPDDECQPLFDNCETQFIAQILDLGYRYLDDPEASFLIEPGNSQGDLAERGANWLFVRWLADHYAAAQPLGTELTRALVQTTARGSENVEAVTGEPFDELVSRWQLANYLEDLPGFTPVDPRLQYTSWALRAVYQQNFEAGVFDKPYPLTPLVAQDGTADLAGTLRGGSGVHLRVVQDPAAPAVELRLTGDDGESVVPAGVSPRIALVRIR